MKILVLGKYNFEKRFGGIEKYCKEQIEELSKNNEVIIIFSSVSKKREIKKEKQLFIELEKFFEILEAPFTKPFFGYLSYFKPDIVWIHIPNPFFELYLLFYILLHKKDFCLIATYHADAPHYTIFSLFADFLRHFFLLPLLFFCDNIIATSKEYIRGSIPLKLFYKKVLVYPIKINKNELKSVKKPKREVKKPYVLFVGRLFKYKGLEYLLKAFKEVENRMKIKLIIVGEGPLKKELIKLSEKLKLKNVEFFGNVAREEKNYLLKNCEIFVLPSINKGEAFGISMVEAMYFSKPIISTKIKGSGVVFVNKHMKTGIVVKPKDSKELAKAILTLLRNKKLAKKLGKNARKRALKFFIKKEKEKYFSKILEEIKCVWKKLEISK